MGDAPKMIGGHGTVKRLKNATAESLSLPQDRMSSRP
jgi:hypothetical protein